MNELEPKELTEETNDVLYNVREEPSDVRTKRQARNKRKYYLRKALRAAGNKRQRKVAKARFRKD